MNKEEIIAELTKQGLVPDYHKDTKDFMISNKIIRCKNNGDTIVAVGNETKKDDPIHGLVDAVHYHLQTQGKTGGLRYILGSRKNFEEQKEILCSLFSLMNAISIPLCVQIEINFSPVEQPLEDFDTALKKRSWFKKITQSQNMTLPDMAKKLSGAVNDDAFRWYRNVTGGNWSGRVEGLQVCSINSKGDAGSLDVGKTGQKGGDGLARKVFIEIAGDIAGNFHDSQIPMVASVIKKLIDSRKSGELNKYQREHLLESRVLRGVAELKVDEKILEPVVTEQPFQFPTLWSPKGSPRFLDALMRDGNIPWAVELKEPTGSSIGQDYRHAVTQAVLYREFIKKASSMHEWFSGLGLTASECRSAVAFPKMEFVNHKQKLLRQHQKVAEAFDIRIIEISQWENRKKCS
ncbi:MAG: hypothetical protein LC660_02840 [Desulfobacteraceae bacterium]|nr:hypothetical protein [Desulfobacteraceae bacterium]